MKKMIGIGLVGLLAFAAALGAGWWMNRPATEEQGQITDFSAPPPAPGATEPQNVPATSTDETDLPLPVRPHPISTQEIFEIAMRLQERENAVAQREQQVQDREDRLNLVFGDLELKQQQVEGLRAEIRSLLRDSEALLSQLGLDQQSLAAKQLELQALQNQVDSLDATQTVENQQNIRMIAGIFKDMEPQKAAQQLSSIWNNGETDFVIQVYAQLEERDSAAIGEYIDETIFTEIITGLRAYQRPSASVTPTRR